MKTVITAVAVAIFTDNAALADIPTHSATYYEAIKPEVQEATLVFMN